MGNNTNNNTGNTTNVPKPASEYGQRGGAQTPTYRKPTPPPPPKPKAQS